MIDECQPPSFASMLFAVFLGTLLALLLAGAILLHAAQSTFTFTVHPK